MSIPNRLVQLYREGGLKEVIRGIRDFVTFTLGDTIGRIRARWPRPMRSMIADEACLWEIRSSRDYRRFKQACELREPVDWLLQDASEDDVLWDIGAHHGLYTVPAALKGVSVIAVEPYPPSIERLHTHIRLNAIEERVEVVESALGMAEGTARISTSAHDATATVAPNQEADTSTGDHVEVPMIRGASLPGPSPTLLMIDVEGLELDVLEGLGARLETVRRAVVEVHEGVDIEQVRASFDEFDIEIRPRIRQDHLLASLATPR